MASNNNLKKNHVKFAGSWFELDDFVKRHPGGQCLIQVFDGRDVTNAFRSYHPQFSDGVLHSVLRRVKDEDTSSVGAKVVEPIKKTPSDEVETQTNRKHTHSVDYRDLQNEVLQALGGVRNSKGTTGFFIKAFAIFSLNVVLETSTWAYGFTLGRAILLGLTVTLIGFNIMHDANHGAVSFNPNENYYLELTGDWVGFSSTYWKHHHNALHHLHTNAEDDPDVRQNPYLRLHPKDERNIINRLQHFYIWPLLALIRFRGMLSETLELAFGYGNENADHQFSEATKIARHFSIFLKALYFLRFIILPLVFVPEWNTALCIAVSIAVQSFYYGCIAVLSHNTIDVKLYPSNGYDENSFMASQVEGSSNWGGGDWFFLCFSGGLNCEYNCLLCC